MNWNQYCRGKKHEKIIYNVIYHRIICDFSLPSVSIDPSFFENVGVFNTISSAIDEYGLTVCKTVYGKNIAENFYRDIKCGRFDNGHDFCFFDLLRIRIVIGVRKVAAKNILLLEHVCILSKSSVAV